MQANLSDIIDMAGTIAPSAPNIAAATDSHRYRVTLARRDIKVCPTLLCVPTLAFPPEIGKFNDKRELVKHQTF